VISNEYISRINASRLTNIEAILSRNNFIMASPPRKDLQPGTMLNVEQGHEVIVGSAATCGVALENKVGEKSFSLPVSTTTTSTENSLPWRGQDSASRAALAKLGVDRIEISFLSPLLEQVSLGTQSRDASMCLENLGGSKSLVVTDALKVAGAKYNLLRRDGTKIMLKEADLARLGILGQLDADKKWSLVVAEPFYIAYRAVSWDTQSNPEIYKEVAGPDSIKPDSSQNVLKTKSGVVNLPATSWSINVLVNASDLYDKASELRKIEASFPGFYIFSEEEFEAKAAGYAVALDPDDQALLRAIADDRASLKKEINYLPPVPRVGRVVIAIGEARASVDFNHIDFKEDSAHTAWYEPSDLTELIPKSYGADGGGQGLATPPVKKFSRDEDHGTHVAGLIAARGGRAPGLLPTVGLFLIDTSSPASLERSIEDARNRGIYIFNFSFTYQDDDSLRGLKQKMQRSWYDRLFIIAAGNEGKDLRTAVARPAPIGWLDEVKNCVGVGAADRSRHLLTQWAPDESRPGDLAKGSNYGKKFVQLLAPGKEIYSTAAGNTYAKATGSSQAVPMVTAAAAMLWAQDVTDPMQIKARLIYTADWMSPDLDEVVWGGFLNYGKAVWGPRSNFVTLQADRAKIYSLDYNSLRVTISGGEIDDPARGPLDRPVPAPSEISFASILRISFQVDQFRIIYLDDSGYLKIIKNVEAIDGKGGRKLQCTEFKEWDPETKTFKDSDGCTQGIPISQIYDYVARVPASVRF
ncbi:MAG TPA: S8 family serine peptidase, partial [Blastocatellia bacterium]